jgi:hypothetical protein
MIPQLLDGDILVCRGNGAIAKGISTATDSWATHTAQVMYVNTELCIFDAQKEGAFPRSFNAWQREYDYEFEVYRFGHNINKALWSRACVQLFGLNYGVAHLTMGFWRKLLGSKDVKAKYGKDGRVVCSELTMRLMWVFGLRVDDPWNYTPNDVRDYLQKNKFQLIYKHGRTTD